MNTMIKPWLLAAACTCVSTSALAADDVGVLAEAGRLVGRLEALGEGGVPVRQARALPVGAVPRDVEPGEERGVGGQRPGRGAAALPRGPRHRRPGADRFGEDRRVPVGRTDRQMPQFNSRGAQSQPKVNCGLRIHARSPWPLLYFALGLRSTAHSPQSTRTTSTFMPG